MSTPIDSTSFGSITIAGVQYDHDVIIQLDGSIRKRKKKLSKQAYGTSHIISLAEAQDVYEEGAKQLIIGTGQEGMVRLSHEAAVFFHEAHCTVELKPTPEAIRDWNGTEKPAIGLFHVTC
jgi:hypothetical protein